jgi:hypothetical protein
MTSAQHSFGSDFMPPRDVSTWHFFRRAAEADLWCAVPAYRAVPAFLLSGQWQFSGHLSDASRLPPGFDSTAAVIADRFNGFYLFQLTQASPGMDSHAQ